jgi:hypothetical protein
MFTFIQKPAINHAHVVVQIFDHNIIQSDCIRVISSALKNDIVKTATKELDCIVEDATNQNNILFHVLFVLFCKTFSNVHHVKALNHCCKNIIQNKNIATHADISLKSGLIQKPYDKTAKIAIKNSLLNIFLNISSFFLINKVLVY